MKHNLNLKEMSNIDPSIKRIHGGKKTLSSFTKVIDFSLAVNPFMEEHFPTDVAINEYPDPTNKGLKSFFASGNHVRKSNIFVGNGSAEIIFLLFTAFAQSGSTIMALSPSYGDYKYYALLHRCTFIPVVTNAPDFEINPLDIGDLLKRHKPRLFFFCNPVNPSGKYYSEAQVKKILEFIPPQTIFVIDEAYVNFVGKKWDSTNLLSHHPNLVILRSVTKDLGLAGVRLGYSISDSEIVRYFEALAPSWNVNSMAQQSLSLLAKNSQIFEETRIQIDKEKLRVLEELKRLGYEFVPSEVNYFLLKVKDAKEAKTKLLKMNILVRDCSSYGLPNYIRVNIRKPLENDMLLVALKKLASQRQKKIHGISSNEKNV